MSEAKKGQWYRLVPPGCSATSGDRFIPDDGFTLTPDEYAKLRELFRWRGHSAGTVAIHVRELCDMIQNRTGKEYEQYT